MENMRYVGFGKETGFGVEANAEFHVFMTSSSLEAAGGNDLSYEAGPGRDKIIRRPGFYTVSGDVTFAADVDSLKKLFEWALGAPATVAGQTYTGSQSRTLPSLTVRVGKDNFEHVFLGCAINSMSIEVSGEFCNVTVSLMGKKDKKASIKAYDDLILGTEYPLAFYDVASEVKYPGDASYLDNSSRVQSLTFSLENNLDAEMGRGLGSRYANFMIAGARAVTLSEESLFIDTSALEALWGSATGVSDKGAIEFAKKITFKASPEAGSSVAKTLTLELPRAVYTAVPIPISGRDTTMMSLELEAYSGKVGADQGVVFVTYSEV